MTPIPADPVTGLPGWAALDGESPKRLIRLLARLRRRQLDHALHGRVVDSAKYAKRARRVMRAPGRGMG
ncbi:MAG: hypothetical protein AAF797_12610 [Planctomycetota bacterium]